MIQISAAGFTGGMDASLGSMSLHNIDLTARTGQVVAITGKPGVGKTALLMAILGEIPPEMGYVEIQGRKAFVGQMVSRGWRVQKQNMEHG